MKKILKVIIVIICLSGSTVHAGEFSRMGVDARGQALGQALTAVENDYNAPFSNPATLHKIEGLDISSLYFTHYEDIQYIQGGISVPYSHGVFSLRYFSIRVDDIYKTKRDDDLPWNPQLPELGRIVADGRFEYYDNLYTFSIGHEWSDNLFSGLSCKVLHKSMEQISSGNALGYDIDVGLLYKLNFIPANLGIALKNIVPGDNLYWESETNEALPAQLLLGASFYPIESLLISTDFKIMFPENSKMRNYLWRGGVEYSPMEGLDLRVGGFEYQEKENLVRLYSLLGLGLKLFNIRFDYAFRPGVITDYNNLHFFSLGISFK